MFFYSFKRFLADVVFNFTCIFCNDIFVNSKPYKRIGKQGMTLERLTLDLVHPIYLLTSIAHTHEFFSAVLILFQDAFCLIRKDAYVRPSFLKCLIQLYNSIKIWVVQGYCGARFASRKSGQFFLFLHHIFKKYLFFNINQHWQIQVLPFGQIFQALNYISTGLDFYNSLFIAIYSL